MATMEQRRARMVSEQLARRGIDAAAVLDAFRRVPREEFVAHDDLRHAYFDGPLGIGYGQTISQPYVVALTVEALALRGHERVLEIGAGSGYAAAILGLLAREVDTIERIPELAATASDRLARLGFANVHVHCADGTLGWPPNAPYEAICVAAGAPRPPKPLLDQLAIGGRLVIPHGDASSQHLVRIIRRSEHDVVEEDLGEVRFVPLVGEAGWPAHA
ncbi:MAG: protein-L-isoaspartate(D-aspartate) O-methyltransferase [Deltaproteobacteria bacterium]|nr:protein-L-isoaspartate(D-aspartate) O-methyltransferase [Deltaproteobacteria bacterium]